MYILLIALGITWFCSAILGYIVGNSKQAGEPGLFLGLFFGPLGVITAFSLDDRPSCPHCGGRLNGTFKTCQHCTKSIIWSDQQTPSEIRNQQLQKNQAVFAQKAKEEEKKIQQRKEERARLREDRKAASSEKWKERREKWESLSSEMKFLFVFWIATAIVFTAVVGGVLISHRL